MTIEGTFIVVTPAQVVVAFHLFVILVAWLAFRIGRKLGFARGCHVGWHEGFFERKNYDLRRRIKNGQFAENPKFNV